MQTYETIPLIYVGDYSPIASIAGGGVAAAEWTSDTYRTPGATRGRVTFAGYAIPPGGRVGSFYYCDNLGRIFQEDETGAVAYSGTSIIAPAHYFFGDAGGGMDEGKSLVRLWSYIVSEDSGWQVRVWPGGEYAYVPDGTRNQPLGSFPAGYSNYAVPELVDGVVASRLQATQIYPTGGTESRVVRKQPLSVHQHLTDGVPHAGRGFTFEYLFFDPVDAEFLGLGGVIGPGSTSRPVYLVTDAP